MTDRLFFRPLIGRATAWSFDRLRLWIEEGIDPASSMRLSVSYGIARLSIAIIWIYQGLVPKLILHHPDELAMLRGAGCPERLTRAACVGCGWAEIAIGALLIMQWRARWPLLFTLVAMPAAAITVVIAAPRFLGAAFNPVTLNLAMFALAIVASLLARDLPTARRCVRRPRRGSR